MQQVPAAAAVEDGGGGGRGRAAGTGSAGGGGVELLITIQLFLVEGGFFTEKEKGKLSIVLNNQMLTTYVHI